MHPSGFDRKGPGTDPRQGEARKPTTNEFFSTRLLSQIGLILAVILGVGALILVVGSLGDEYSGMLRTVSIGILVGLGAVAIFLVVRRRLGRRSLDDALRSRRTRG